MIDYNLKIVYYLYNDYLPPMGLYIILMMNNYIYYKYLFIILFIII